jgi:hypothetical protein
MRAISRALSRPSSSSNLASAPTVAPSAPLPLPSAPPSPSRLPILLAAGFLLCLVCLASKFSILCTGSPALGLAAGRALRSGPASQQQPPPLQQLPEDTIHIAVTACGNPSPQESEYYGLLSLKSLLMARALTPARNRSYAFHIVTDVSAEELFGAHKVNFDVQRLVAAEPALLSLHLYQAQAVDASAARLGLAHAASVPHTIFKNCAAARLKLPLFLPPSIPRLLYLDWDLVALSDLTELWGEFQALEASHPAATLGMALNDPTGISSKDSYRQGSSGQQPAAPPCPSAGSVNSGVMLWQLARIHSRGLAVWWEQLTGIVGQSVELEKAEYWSLTKAFPLGDQDIVNKLLSPAYHPEYLHLLPPKYNYCLVEALPPAWVDSRAAAAFRRQMPHIVHFCGSRLTQEGMREDGQGASVQDKATKALYDFYTHYVVLDALQPSGLPASA